MKNTKWVFLVSASALIVLCGCKTINSDLLEKPESLAEQALLSKTSEKDIQTRLSEIQQSIAALQERKSRSSDSAERAQLKREIEALVVERSALKQSLDQYTGIDKLQNKAVRDFERGTGSSQERATSICLMATLDARYRHAANRPETHQRLVGAIKKEYATPRAKKAAGQDLSQLASQAVYWLAETDGPFDYEFFLSALADTRSARDPEFIIRRSVLHALQPHIPMIATNVAWRNHLLVGLALAQNDLLVKGESREAAEMIRGPLSWYINEMVTVSNVVDALEAAGDEPVEVVMRMLEWDYRLNATGVPPSEVLRERHGIAVGRLFWHSDGQVRARSRVVLTTRDPVLAVRVLGDRIQSSDPLLQEDFAQFAATLPAADKVLEGCSDTGRERYRKAHQEGATGLYGRRWPEASVKTRETVCSLLLASDPKVLAGQLIAVTPSEIARANVEQAVQHIRYLGALRRPLANDADQTAGLVRSLQTCLAHQDLVARQQAVAQLLQDPPGILLTGLRPVMQGILSEPGEQAEFLLTTWLSTLKRAEQEAAKGDLKKAPAAVASDLREQLTLHPYSVVATAMMRPEFDLRCMGCAFLKERDPEVMILDLLAFNSAKATEQAEPCDIDYLGNAAASVWAELTEETRMKVVAWHKRGLADPDEDKAMLHSSLLVQLGGMDEEAAGTAPKVVKETWRMINENH